MTFNELYKKLIENEMPGFIIGLDRSPNSQYRFRSHIYKGDFSEPGDPMCPRGWNREKGESYSIWRNNLGTDICRTCIKNTLKELSHH